VAAGVFTARRPSNQYTNVYELHAQKNIGRAGRFPVSTMGSDQKQLGMLRLYD
jgi:hypothetical protein